jgi:hypothetical protein
MMTRIQDFFVVDLGIFQFSREARTLAYFSSFTGLERIRTCNLGQCLSNHAGRYRAHNCHTNVGSHKIEHTAPKGPIVLSENYLPNI